MITEDTEDAVIVRFYDYASKFWTPKERDLTPLHALEEELEDVIERTGAGELDGHEIAVDGSNGVIFMYGPNADQLFAAIEPVLARSPVAKGAKVTLRYGDACACDVLEKNVKINAPLLDVHN